MTLHVFERDSLMLSGYDTGQGTPVVFQHGLGGDETQIADVFPNREFRRLTLECRAHGKSQAGDPRSFTIASFADDVLAFADAQGIDRFAVGGISMGAAIALRIAVKNPERVSALVLARPAWGWGAKPDNMQVFAELAEFLKDGRCDDFANSDTAHILRTQGPDNLQSLLKFFDRPDPLLASSLISAIAADGPRLTEEDVRGIQVPALVIANGIDWVHPVALAKRLAGLIPCAKFVEITPKATDKLRHASEFRKAVKYFLEREGSAK